MSSDDRVVRRKFLNPKEVCACPPTQEQCDHSFIWPDQGIHLHRPQTTVEVSMPASQPCPDGLVEVTDDAPKKGRKSTSDAPASEEA